jgi:glutathione synthase/RimK-type ligase-like ATP-grasp enzyme
MPQNSQRDSESSRLVPPASEKASHSDVEESTPLPPPSPEETELKKIEHQLRSNPTSLELQFRRAVLLSELGQFTEARVEYLKMLERDPGNLAVLNNLGNLLLTMKQNRAAQIAYREAVAKHPDDPMSRVNLGNLLLFEIEQLEACQRNEDALKLKHEAREHYQQALRVKDDHQQAHEGLSYLLADLGDPEKAEWHRRQAFRNRFTIALPYNGQEAPVQVLQLLSTSGGNVRLQKFLDERIFQTFVVLPEFYDFSTPLPAHQLVINAIGDVEVSPKALKAAQDVLALTSAPVINPPSAVMATSRSNNAERLANLPGVVTAITTMLTRKQLAGSDVLTTLARKGLTFPLLLRAPGFHTGLNFILVESPESLPAALAEIPGNDLIVMQYLDARGTDGKSRKYRTMMIGGELYPLHLAISSHWKIHYFTAEMAENATYRAEDRAFLEDMPRVLGPVAMNALKQIQSVLGLDYGGIDFALSRKGEVLLFEANASMVVNPPDADERWSYRLPAYNRIHAAVQKMFKDKAADVKTS